MPSASFTFDDLITWSERLLLWQRDALRRVLTGRLTDSDIADLAAMAKAEYSLGPPGRPSPVPATSAHVPAASASSPPVSVNAIRDITYVNALASGPVTFAPEGLTVIYGDNASGKSGVTRILKKAGRAREPGGTIRPSVFEPDPRKPASAVIEYRVGTENRSASWVDGATTDPELSQLNVFDACCGAVQIEEDNRLAYTPRILQTFQDLAEACRAVGAKLRAEQEALERSRPPQLNQLALRPQTQAGVLGANVSVRTTNKEIDALCDLTAEERELHAALGRALQDNPNRQADLLDARAHRLRDLDSLTSSLEKTFSSAALQEVETLVAEYAAADEAAKAATLTFASGSTLAGIGGEAWKRLWESARRYSEAQPYPGESFPVTRDGAVCVLCQQPIEKASAERLNKFEKFVQDDVQRLADQARDNVESRKRQLEAIKLPLSGTQQREAALRGTAEGEGLKAFIVGSKLRRRYLLRKAKGQNPRRTGDFPSRPDFGSLRASLAEEITRLRAAAQNDERRKMQSEFGELDDRIKLAPLKDTLKNEVARLIYSALLDRVRTDCDTTWITRKGGEAAQTVVTARLTTLPRDPCRVAIGANAIEKSGIDEPCDLVLQCVFQWSQFDPVVELAEFTLHLPPLIVLGSSAQASNFLRKAGAKAAKVGPRRKVASPSWVLTLCFSKEIATAKFRANDKCLQTLSLGRAAKRSFALLSSRQRKLDGFELPLAAFHIVACLVSKSLNVVLDEFLELVQTLRRRFLNRLLAKHANGTVSRDRKRFTRIRLRFRIPASRFPQPFPRFAANSRKG